MEIIKSPLNYNGNKYKLLPYLLDIFPTNISVFVDLFGGSGVVSLNTKADHVIYNDIVPYVKDILEGIKTVSSIEGLIQDFEQIIEEYNLSKENKEGFDMLREFYNKGNRDWKTLYTLICYSFNTQYRFNSRHEYNSSFGKSKSCFSEITQKKLRHAYERLKTLDIIFTSKPFDEFDFTGFDENDLVYLDPPYFGSTGNYNDGKRGFKGWSLEDENKLRLLIQELDKKGVRFVLSNNFAVNTTLEEWCKVNGFKVLCINDHDYNNSSYQKKIRTKDREVIIYNY